MLLLIREGLLLLVTLSILANPCLKLLVQPDYAGVLDLKADPFRKRQKFRDLHRLSMAHA